MFEQYFMPLARHFDGGFHATGDAFKSAAEKLSADDNRTLRALNAHLPINYLYRHAIELYLKSMVLILTRVVEKNDLPVDPTRVKVQVANDKPLTTVHSVKSLLEEVQQLVTANAGEISRLTPIDWNVPSELQTWIDVIEQHDSGSTFSRYPTSKSTLDSIKSSFQSIEPEAVVTKMEEQKPGENGQFVLLVKNDADEIVEAFNLRDEILPEPRTALVEASNLLSGSAFGLQAELVEGYGWKMQQWRAEAREAASKAEAEQPQGVREAEPNFDDVFEQLEPRLGEIVEAAQQSLETDPVLICCETAKVATAHPVVLDLFHKYGKECVVQLSETLFCLPVSNQQLREGLAKYPGQSLDEAIGISATGIWIMCFEDKGIYMRRAVMIDEAE